MVEKKKKTTKAKASSKVKKAKKPATKAKPKVKSKAKKVDEVYKLGAVMNIAHAEKMSLGVKKYMANSNKRIFDASEVERITTPCLQLLLSIAKLSKEDGVEFQVKSPSDVFSKAVEDLGMSNELNN